MDQDKQEMYDDMPEINDEMKLHFMTWRYLLLDSDEHSIHLLLTNF